MGKEKIAITLDADFISELDRLIDANVFQNRSQAIQEAVKEKLLKLKRVRLAKECANLEPGIERAFSEDGFDEDIKQWPEY